jgi:septal ring factor EnvC (AmiA/AmiB activator)
MSTPTNHSALPEALDQLESYLELPVVPGEAENWLGAVRQACDDVSEHLVKEIHGPHADLLAKTQRQDPALAPRVEEMHQTDQQLLEECQALQRTIERLTDMAAKTESDEARLEPWFKELTDSALTFILDVRKQEAAVTTWYMEAFNRDRGVGD